MASFDVAAALHASRHAATGEDRITPEMIGALADGYAPAWGDVTGKPATFPPSGHAGSHAVGGADPLTGYLPINSGAYSGHMDDLTTPGVYWLNGDFSAANGGPPYMSTPRATAIVTESFNGYINVRVTGYESDDEWVRTLAYNGWDSWTPIHADTRWRDITGLLRAGWTAGRFDIRRINHQVYVRIRGLTGDGTSSSIIDTRIQGFSAPNYYFVQADYSKTVGPALNLGAIGTEAFEGQVRFLRSNPTTVTDVSAALSWPTDDPSPDTLPGIPA